MGLGKKKVYLGLQVLLMFYSIGGIFSKKAAQSSFLSEEYIKYYLLVLGILAVYAVFWQQILKRLPLTVAMANKSVTVIWGMLYGYVFFHERITIYNLVGALCIMAGIYVVAGEDKQEADRGEADTCI